MIVKGIYSDVVSILVIVNVVNEMFMVDCMVGFW